MKLHVLDQGYIEAQDAPFLTETGEREAVTAIWPVRCHLLEHPAGWLLWDTGLPEEPLRGDPLALGGYTKVVIGSVQAWLAGFGLSPGEDRLLIGLSHMHIDHAGNASLFAGNRVLVSRREFEHAMSDHADEAYYRPGYADLDASEIVPTSDGYDVFGDGVAVIHAAPGHSPGHQTLLVSLPDEQPVLLTGDACYSVADLAHRRAPIWNFNQRQTFRSLDKLVELARQTGARLAFHHDPATPG